MPNLSSLRMDELDGIICEMRDGCFLEPFDKIPEDDRQQLLAHLEAEWVRRTGTDYDSPRVYVISSCAISFLGPPVTIYRHTGYNLPLRKKWDDLKTVLLRRPDRQLNRTVNRLCAEGRYPLNPGWRELEDPLRLQRQHSFSRK